MKAARTFVAAVLLLSATTLPSFARHPNLDHFYHSRLQADLVDESPLITDKRQPRSRPQTIVVEAATPEEPTAPPMVIRPSGAGVNVPNITVLRDGLPDARFQSAMTPANQSHFNPNLPNGRSTNGLAGRMIAQAPVNTTKPAAKVAPSISRPAAAQSVPVAMVYPTTPTGSSGYLTQNSTANLKGQILPRGTLLNH